ncbi:MAG: hypothetical protein ACI4QV_04190, partial [Acutalibacteraceae bacterium]
RTLELLGYFEPEDDYEYGIYDEATQTALAEYQDDELEQPSFNADSYAHMFGPETATIRTEERIRLLHKLRFVHNQVAREVSNRVAGRTDETTIRGAGLSSDYGYADVMKTVPAIETEYIWEVKPWGEKYRVLNGIGAIQLARYINAWNREFQNYNGPKYTAKQGYSVGKFAIEITPFNDSYILVESNSAPAEDIRSGLVHYKVIDKTDYPRSEYAKQYSLEKRAEENRQPHYSPTLSPAYGYAFSHETEIGNADLAIKIVGIAACGAAALVLVLYGGEIIPIATSALQALAAFLFSSPVSALA